MRRRQRYANIANGQDQPAVNIFFGITHLNAKIGQLRSTRPTQQRVNAGMDKGLPLLIQLL